MIIWKDIDIHINLVAILNLEAMFILIIATYIFLTLGRIILLPRALSGR